MADGIEYLMGGDPAIRWQAMRDLLGAPAEEWQKERARVAKEGWGARILAEQKADGSWPPGRWTASIWTFLTLMELGVPPDDKRLAGAFDQVAGRLMPKGETVSREDLKTRMDLCHLGFWLRIGGYFSPQDERLTPLWETILNLQMEDGGWNCRIRTKPGVKHSSFHTTFNILEGLREAAMAGCIPMDVFEASEARALEFMLQHQMYRSDKTGEVVHHRFLELSFPSYWHYTVLRGLDYVRQTPFIADLRLTDPLSFLESRRKANGRWPVEKRIPGVTFFDMEKMGQDSRWNTLRALRVLVKLGK